MTVHVCLDQCQIEILKKDMLQIQWVTENSTVGTGCVFTHLCGQNLVNTTIKQHYTK